MKQRNINKQQAQKLPYKSVYNCSSPGLIASRLGILGFPANISPITLAAKITNILVRNPSFCYFASFLIVSLTVFISKPDSSSNLTFFMILSISLFQISSAVVPDL